MATEGVLAVDGGQFTNFQELVTGPSTNCIYIGNGTRLDQVDLLGASNDLEFNLDNYCDPAKRSSPFSVLNQFGTSVINLNQSSNSTFAITFGGGGLDPNLITTINDSTNPIPVNINFADYSRTVGGIATLNLNGHSNAELSFNGGNVDNINISSASLADTTGRIVIADHADAIRSADAQLDITLSGAYAPDALYYALLTNNELAISVNGLDTWMLIAPGGVADESNILLSYRDTASNTTYSTTLDHLIQTIGAYVPGQLNSADSISFYSNSASHAGFAYAAQAA